MQSITEQNNKCFKCHPNISSKVITICSNCKQSICSTHSHKKTDITLICLLCEELESNEFAERVENKILRYNEYDMEKFGLIGDINEKFIKLLMIIQKFKCYICKEILLLSSWVPYCTYQFSIDRIIDGKPHDCNNCLISCMFCNVAAGYRKLKCRLNCHWKQKKYITKWEIPVKNITKIINIAIIKYNESTNKNIKLFSDTRDLISKPKRKRRCKKEIQEAMQIKEIREIKIKEMREMREMKTKKMKEISENVIKTKEIKPEIQKVIKEIKVQEITEIPKIKNISCKNHIYDDIYVEKNIKVKFNNSFPNEKSNIDMCYISSLLDSQNYKCYICDDNILLSKWKKECYYQFQIEKIDNNKLCDIGNILICCDYCYKPKYFKLLKKDCEKKCHKNINKNKSRSDICTKYINNILNEAMYKYVICKSLCSSN